MVNMSSSFGEHEMDLPLLFLYNQTNTDLLRDERVESDHNMDQTSSYLHPNYPYVEMPLHQSIIEEHVTYEQLDLKPSGYPSLLAPHHAGQKIEISLPDLHHHGHLLTNTVSMNRPMLSVPGYSMTYKDNQVFSLADNASTGTYSPCITLVASNGCPQPPSILTSGSSNTSSLSSMAEDTVLDSRPPSPQALPSPPEGKLIYDEVSDASQVGQDEPSMLLEFLENFETMSNVNTNLTKPAKILQPSLEYSCSKNQDQLLRSVSEVKKELGMEPCYFMPTNWPNHVLTGISSMPVNVHPGLDWPLPSSTDQYELRIEVQPRHYHRAHYETEGSRGPVKACSEGHPVVQLCGYTGTEPLPMQIFIGTSDNRNLRPHAFYQVHRITGKAVTISSQERILNGTKILEVSLEPNINMKAVIDCAGILKLRNADIELRKGKTDGRKNTRVKLVFRVHIPQAGGQWVSLQAASDTIECTQRSAIEQPAVERHDVDHCSALGGVQMSLRGQNFTTESRVVFFKKSEIGIKIWEAEARIHKDRSTPNMLLLDIPPYRSIDIYCAVKVNFQVLNSKRKCSQPQHFTYTPLTEPKIEDEAMEECEYAQLEHVEPPVMSLSPSCHFTDGFMMSTPCPSMYSSAPQSVSSHYQLDPSLPGPLPHSPGRPLSLASEPHGTTSLPLAGSSTHQHLLPGESASLFTIVDVGELCTSGNPPLVQQHTH